MVPKTPKDWLKVSGNGKLITLFCQLYCAFTPKFTAMVAMFESCKDSARRN